jgi:signal-transduction protein with cAMP-binding, CBS, and nucleotidyltransferase domain
MRISDVLARKSDAVALIGQKDILQAAADIMHAGQIGSVVVVNEISGKTVGIVSQPELLAAIHDLGTAALSQCVNGIMRRTNLQCELSDDVQTVMVRMVQHRIRHMVAVNASDQVVGMISMGDLVAARMKSYQLETGVLRDMALAHNLAA